MAGKRSATTELNHENWNEENEPEEAGTFTKAADDVLQKRVVKAARRRLLPKDGQTRGAFGTFTFFRTTPTTGSSPFSFLASTAASTLNNTNTTTTSSLMKTSTSTTKSVTVASNGASTNAQNGAKKEDSSDNQSSAPAKKDQKDEKQPNKSNEHTSNVKGLKDNNAQWVKSRGGDSSDSQLPSSKKEQTDEKVPKKSNKYFANLKGLNESVARWIKSHVDDDPFCILTPIFKDYEKYLKEIETKYGNETDKGTSEGTAFSAELGKDTANTEKKPNSSPFAGAIAKPLTTEYKPEKSIFSSVSTSKSVFGNPEQSKEGSKSVFNSPEPTAESHKSIFGSADKGSGARSVFGNTDKNPFLSSKSPSTSESKPEESETKPEPKTTSSSLSSTSVNSSIFSFGQSSTTTNATAGFSFGSAKPFSFGAQAVTPQDSENTSENESKDDDDKPPESDFKPIKEEGAIYEQRCKVFLKDGQNYTVKGVGTLFLKPTSNDKTQLIVRADTAVGNIILNTFLTERTPTMRMNKNTVMIVCMPSVDATQPATFLLRVKTEEDADSLIEAFNKHKK